MVVVQCFETVGWKGIWPLKTCTSYPRDCLSEQVKNEKQSVSWKMFFIKRYAGSNPINTSAVPPPHTHRCFTIIIWVNLCWPAPLPQRFNACMPVLTATVAFAVSQWPSGNMPDCGERTQVRISLRAVVFITTVTAIYSLGHGRHTLTAVPRSTQPSTLRGTVKWVSALELSNNKWRWWMWTVAAISFWRTHSPSRLAWSEGWWPPRRWVCIHQMNWVNALNGFALPCVCHAG